MKLLKILCLFLLLLVPVSYAITASIGNAKMILRPSVLPGKKTVIEKSIKVNNVNDVPVDINLAVHDDLVDIVELLDKNFTLQPGETRNANFIITLEYGGHYEGKIGVRFTPVGGGQGVGLSSTIIILAEGPENPNPDIEPVSENQTAPDDQGDDIDDTTIDNTGGGVSVGGGSKDNTQVTGSVTGSKKGFSTLGVLIGFMIMLTIILVGVAIYILVTRLK